MFTQQGAETLHQAVVSGAVFLRWRGPRGFPLSERCFLVFFATSTVPETDRMEVDGVGSAGADVDELGAATIAGTVVGGVTTIVGTVVKGVATAAT